MKTARPTKPYRDQTIYRDIGFLLLVIGTILVQAFDHSLQDAMLYAPLIVGGAFGALLGAGYLLTGTCRAIDALGTRFGMGRTPRR